MFRSSLSLISFLLVFVYNITISMFYEIDNNFFYPVGRSSRICRGYLIRRVRIPITQPGILLAVFGDRRVCVCVCVWERDRERANTDLELSFLLSVVVLTCACSLVPSSQLYGGCETTSRCSPKMGSVIFGYLHIVVTSVQLPSFTLPNLVLNWPFSPLSIPRPLS